MVPDQIILAKPMELVGRDDAATTRIQPMRPPLRDQKFADSLLEGAGFEPSVPRE